MCKDFYPKSNPGTMTKIKTDSKNRFKYGFMAIGAIIEGFNYVIRSVIFIDATHLKARTRGVLIVTVCKDGKEMIYPLAFGFANSECTESWTWFLKKLHKVIQYPDRVMLVSDRHDGIFNALKAIFPDAAHEIFAYHLAQNIKRFCKHMDDVIWLYYHATYAYRIKEFDRAMAELKETYRKVYDELLGARKKKNLPERPKKLRIPSAGEKRKLQSCSKCGKKGHNKITFLEPSSSTCKPVKKARTCSIYKKEEHNRLKCPDKPHEPTLIDTDEENAVGEPLLNFGG
ncbi:hypothetical protein Dsin_019476 [Dipteronia sinensis]|uniref:MULE transposase domain-containing protein n=1 Tax=Dipteronia sinensis TaxID=43782 RepID=A0AAE0A7M5_9ROSI|nr:hypothetical protein Dsin_019476 [Dipteronia sinensis]